MNERKCIYWELAPGTLSVQHVFVFSFFFLFLVSFSVCLMLNLEYRHVMCDYDSY